MRKAGVGKSVEDAANQGAQAVGAQTAGEAGAVYLAVGHFAQRQKHAGGLDHHHDHHQRHRQNQDRVKHRKAELKRHYEIKPGCLADFVKVHQTQRRGHHAANHDTK